MGAVVCALAVGLVGVTAVSAGPVPPFIPADAPWLTTVNYYRAMAGLAPVVEDPAMSAGALLHSCYMLHNGITHDELPGLPGFTSEGDAAGNSGNVAVSSVAGQPARTHIELWMSGPFHAIGVLRHNLLTTGYGQCDDPNGPVWRSGATLDVLRGLGDAPRPPTPTLFPGNGTTTNLDRFTTESPNPVSFCPGWSNSVGLPILAMMPEAAISAGGSLTGPNGPIEVCVLSAANTTGIAQQLLAGDNAVIIIPRTPLAEGAYSVTASTAARSVAWSFNVDQLAKVGLLLSAIAAPSGPAVGFQPIASVRSVDTRSNLGTIRLQPGVQQIVPITGRLGIPAGTSAINANITVVNPSGPGFLTVWNCSADRPTASSVNFTDHEVVANAAMVPLDRNGALCVFSPVGADVIIDIGGIMQAGAAGRLSAVAPTRVMDTRIGLGPSGRLKAGETATLSVAGTAGIPDAATAVAMNITTIDPADNGFVTAYTCGGPRPEVSTVNPVRGLVRPNLAVIPMSADGTVCIYTLTSVDLAIDLVGYMSPAGNMLTPSTPFRFTDTRDRYRVEVNAGTGGTRLAGGTTAIVLMAGVRGIPATAGIVSANITVTDATGPGFVTVWPCGPRPTASNVNFTTSGAVANASFLTLSTKGLVCVYASADAHVIIDVNGWWG